MKKLLMALGLLALPVLAQAGTLTITTNNVADNRLTRERLRRNAVTCAAAALPADCTQAEARAVNPGADVYSDDSDYVDRVLLKPHVKELKGNDSREDYSAWCINFWFNAGTTNAQRNAECVKAGKPNNCNICEDAQ